MNYSDLLAVITNNITSNNQKAITGLITRNVLTAMVNSLGAGYQFIGFATPATNPGTPDQRVFYIAIEDGTYQYFNNLEVAGLTILYWSDSWSKQVLPGSGGGGGGGSTVAISNLLTTGSRIGTLTINGTNYDIKASVVALSNRLTSGDRILTINLNGTDYDVMAPQYSLVSVRDRMTSGTKICTLQINNSFYDLYAPSPGGGGSTVAIADLFQNGLKIGKLTIDGTDSNINVPEASASQPGVVSMGAQTFTGTKTFGTIHVDRIYIGPSAYLEWDSSAGAVKLVGNFYATGNIAAGD